MRRLLLLLLSSMLLLIAPTRAQEIVVPPTPVPQLAPISAVWVGTTLHIVTTQPGCLWLLGGGKPATPLPDSCGVGEYLIGPNFLDANYSPSGRSVGLQRYDGRMPFVLLLPPRIVVGLPMMAGP